MHIANKEYNTKVKSYVMTNITSCFRHRVETLPRVRKQPVADEKQAVGLFFLIKRQNERDRVGNNIRAM